MTQDIRVAAIGECMVELQERPDGGITQSFGGDTFNTAVYLARAGVDVAYATALGDDAFSGDILALGAAEGVDMSLVPRAKGKVPGLYLITTDDAGERIPIDDGDGLDPSQGRLRKQFLAGGRAAQEAEV